MKAVSIAELRDNAEDYLDAVARGETIEVHRDGRPVAQIRPVRRGRHPRWVNRAEPIRLRDDASLSEAVLADRREGTR